MTAVALGLCLGGAASASAQSRFLSYGSEGECLAGHVLAAPLCRSAFANARTEFESRTPSFPSLSLCAKVFGDCAAWPPEGSSTSSFRPRWNGVDIVDTPQEKSVTPAAVAGRGVLKFAALPLTEFRGLDVRGARHPAAPIARAAGPNIYRSPEPSGPAAPPPPGSGFKLEDGVLTYPAPSRFQPKNLPKRP